MIYALTGITGLLGRNLFLEIIKKNINDLFKTKFILFGRNSKTKTLKIFKICLNLVLAKLLTDLQ